MTTQKTIYIAPSIQIQEMNNEDLMVVSGGGYGLMGIGEGINNSENVGAKAYDDEWDDEE